MNTTTRTRPTTTAADPAAPQRPAPITDAVTAHVDRIMLDPSTAFPALEHALDDPTERVRTWELDAAEREAYEAGFLTGYNAAAPHLHAELAALRQQLARAEADADRFYAELCRRPAPKEPDRVPYAELCRRRGEHDRAARAEEWAASMGAGYGRVGAV